MKNKLDILRRHCDAEKRDYDAIRKTLLWMSSPHADDFPAQAEAFAKLGITELIAMPFDPDPVAWVSKLEPVVRRLAEIG